MYKAVFSDFDGTLLTSDHKISPKTLKAIQRITKKGIPFVPISARSPLGILPYAKQLGNIEYIVAFSGGLILDKNLQPLYGVQISSQDELKIYNSLRDFPNFAVNWYIYNDCFSRDVNHYWTDLERKITGIEINQAEQGKLYSPHKIQVIGEAEEIIEIENLLKNQFDTLSICRSHANYLEIMEKSATKGNAVRFLENYFNVKMEECLAFGDNYNDIDMLQNVGLGIAMGNAPEAIKQIAKRVTASNNEDGIALILDAVFA